MASAAVRRIVTYLPLPQLTFPASTCLAPHCRSRGPINVSNKLTITHVSREDPSGGPTCSRPTHIQCHLADVDKSFSAGLYQKSRPQNEGTARHLGCLTNRRGMLCQASSSDAEETGTTDRHVEAPDVAELAAKARLAITPEEVVDYGESLGRIVEWFGQLQDIDVEGVPPAVRVGESEDDNFARPDVAVTFSAREAMLAEVPDMEGPYLKVPKILNENPDG